MKWEIWITWWTYSLSDIQDHFQKILKKNVEKTYNSLIRIYVNKIRNIITFKIRTEYYLNLLTSKMMKLLGNIKDKITKDENG